MASRADLHCHTTFSDGSLTPTQLVDRAVQRGVEVMALTDHDCTDGLPEALEAASRHAGFLLIPGVELSTDVPQDEVHVLGYFIDWQSPAFQEHLDRMRRSRLHRGRAMLDKLRELGIDLSWERVQEIAGEGAVGRPHIALAILEAGRIKTLDEAFDKYLGRNGPAYVEREKMLPTEAVELITSVSGLPVLAHPAQLKDLDRFLEELKRAGLLGMEVYYQYYGPEDIDRLLAAARRHDLLPLGGSDFHGIGGGRERDLGDIPLPFEPVEQLIALARERGRIAAL
ncbi:MAG TPA: PHP domain-containing protein [Dehalococcoidia bacterium]|nr:PHP domain-containing protein [Dehalococcoidia bacterium]